jgi:DNA polymerase III epsilon subunit-like protein
MLVIIFDTETTGLPQTKILNNDTLDLWPYIVQFSYIIYDTDINAIMKVKDSIIKIPENIIITEENTSFHGITNEISLLKGVSIEDVIHEFFSDIKNVELIIAHNITFDINMLKVELLRLTNNKTELFKEFINEKYLSHSKLIKNLYCTMQESIYTCNIVSTYKNGRKYTKYPKLVELCQHLFNETPINLHNSLNDVVVTLRCFMKINYDVDIIETNDDVKVMFEVLRPII